jgi:hypothetical protein
MSVEAGRCADNRKNAGHRHPFCWLNMVCGELLIVETVWKHRLNAQLLIFGRLDSIAAE